MKSGICCDCQSEFPVVPSPAYRIMDEELDDWMLNIEEPVDQFNYVMDVHYPFDPYRACTGSGTTPQFLCRDRS